MPIRVSYQEEIFETSMVSFHGNTCEAKSPYCDISITFEYKHEINDTDNPNDYCMQILYKTNISENDIYQIFDNHDRIGWIFPLTAIDSFDHDYAENPHFLIYAHLAFQKLTEDKDNISRIIQYEELNSCYHISDCYDDDAVVFLCKISSIPISPDVCDFYYLPFLRGIGYGYKQTDIGARYIVESNKINIKGVSKNLVGEKYIENIFKSILYAPGNNALYKFVVLYQIIELLMQRIVDDQINSISKKITEGDRDITKIKQLFYEISDEQKRINKVFQDFCRLSSCDYNEFLIACNVIITNLGYAKEDHPESALYKIRNILVHNYRMVSEIDISNNILSTVNEELEWMVIDMIINYQE